TLRTEWMDDTVARALTAAHRSPAYQEHLRDYYEKQRARSPATIPYTFEQYVELQKVRPQGSQAFGKAVEKMFPTAESAGEARLRADFEAAKKHELFQGWWGSSSVAQFIRRQVSSGAGGTERLERMLYSFLNVPVDLGTALLLSLFICLDFPNLKRAV